MVNGIVSLMLILLSHCYCIGMQGKKKKKRNARDFCILILYSANLLYLLIKAGNYMVVFRVFYVEDHFNCKQWELYFFSNLDYFISFSSLIAMAKPSKTLLNGSGESGHPCFVPDFRGNAIIFFFFFAIENNYCGFIIYDFYYVEVCSF